MCENLKARIARGFQHVLEPAVAPVAVRVGAISDFGLEVPRVGVDETTVRPCHASHPENRRIVKSDGGRRAGENLGEYSSFPRNEIVELGLRRDLVVCRVEVNTELVSHPDDVTHAVGDIALEGVIELAVDIDEIRRLDALF